MSTAAVQVSRSFIWRRIHSLTGLMLVLFIMEHLFTNSQAALFFGDSGSGFVRAVNFLHNLPYLQVVEIILLGVPFALHIVLGIRYAITGKYNAHKSNGSKPSMQMYGRNRAYSWQRFTAWVLIFGVIGHVWYMRFYDYPVTASIEGQKTYFVRVDMDHGLYTVAKRLGVTLFDQNRIQEEFNHFRNLDNNLNQSQKEVDKIKDSWPRGILSAEEVPFNDSLRKALDRNQYLKQQKLWLDALTSRPISDTQVIAAASQFGDAVLLNVRNTFKSPLLCILYTIFVVCACFHAFNGLWTFCLSWGVIMRYRSQSRVLNACIAIMVVIALLGLVAIWGTYWVNLKH